MKKLLAVATVLFVAGCAAPEGTTTPEVTTARPTLNIHTATPTKTPTHKPTKAPAYSVILIFHLSRYPNIADHVRDAQKAGESKICTIDRLHARQHRAESLADEPDPPAGKDRDEYPPAMCKEGGKGADVRLVPSSENRSAGSWMGHQLHDYSNGTRVLFKVTE